MKAIVQDRYGDADVLELREIERPVPRAGEVLVRVHAAAVDPGVWHLMTGLPYLVRVFGHGLLRPKHRVVGMDLAGRVEALGAGVTGFQVGDEVFGATYGAFAEYACPRQDRIARKPRNLTFEQAAAVPTSATTALQGVRDHGRLQPGQAVLVLGAAGGVGSFAVQIARVLGGRVTGVCSTSKVDLVRSLGAEDVVDHTREDVTEGPRRFDLIVDTGGRRPLARLRRILTARGTLVIVGGEGGDRWLGGMHRPLGALLLSPFVRQRLTNYVAVLRASDLDLLREHVEAGRITPVIDRVHPLHEAADAIRAMQEGRGRGKRVLRIVAVDQAPSGDGATSPTSGR